VVTDLQLVKLVGSFAQSNNLADELMSGCHGWLAISRSVLVAPKHRSSGVALDITRADARALDPDNNFARTRFRDRQFLQTVIRRAVPTTAGIDFGNCVSMALIFLGIQL
jgi:hypothetical protein